MTNLNVQSNCQTNSSLFTKLYHKPILLICNCWSEWGDSFTFLPEGAEIEERLGQALAGGAHPRRIEWFESPCRQNKKAERAKTLSAFLEKALIMDTIYGDGRANAPAL